jgi:hypothetical protein
MSTMHVSLLRVHQPKDLAYVSLRNPHSESKPFMDPRNSNPFVRALLLPAANVATSLLSAIFRSTWVAIGGCGLVRFRPYY